MMYGEHKGDYLKSLKKVMKKAGTDLGKKTVTQAERRGSIGCAIAREVFHEALEQYESGGRDWESVVDDLTKTLKAIDSSLFSTKEKEEVEED